MSWWRHQMETFFALLAFCAGNSPVTGEFPIQSPVTRSFGGFFDLRLNKRFSKQSWDWWFETPLRHCDVIAMCIDNLREDTVHPINLLHLAANIWMYHVMLYHDIRDDSYQWVRLYTSVIVCFTLVFLFFSLFLVNRVFLAYSNNEFDFECEFAFVLIDYYVWKVWHNRFNTGHRWIPSQRLVTRSFTAFFDLRLNKRLSK